MATETEALTVSDIHTHFELEERYSRGRPSGETFWEPVYDEGGFAPVRLTFPSKEDAREHIRRVFGEGNATYFRVIAVRTTRSVVE